MKPAVRAKPRRFGRAALRILHVDSGRTWRGGQRQALLLAAGLRQAGDENVLAGQPDSPLIERARAASIETAEITMRSDWDLLAAHRLRALIRASRADIVHAHDARAHAVAMLALPGRMGVPLVVTRRVAFKPKAAGVKYGKRVARFIAISRAVRDSMVESGISRDRITVVYSGVPTPVVTKKRDWRAECRWSANSIVCGVVGAMTREKGVQAVNAIGSRLPGEEARRTRLVLIGEGEVGRSTMGGLDAYNVGFVEQVHDAIAGLDMLWHPSESEGLGTSVMDAMALCVPPVAFATGGLAELIQNGRDGLLVPPANVQAFADAATLLIRDPALRRQLAAAGPARAAEFGVERMIAGSREVYQAVERQYLR